MYRIGFSEDIHPVTKGEKVILGGTQIPSDISLVGHSDADVVLHAVTESIFGALSLGDLGEHFPDNDPKYKDISSSLLVKEVVSLMDKEGYEINNIDVQIAAKRPRLSDKKNLIKENIAKLLKTDIKNVSIKAMSNNNVGPIGKGEAIKSSTIVLLKRK